MEKLLLVIHIISAVLLVGVILLQKSEGGALGGLGGSDPSAGVLSARGTATALSKITAILAIVFMATALLMAAATNKSNTNDEILEKVKQPLLQKDGEVPLAD